MTTGVSRRAVFAGVGLTAAAATITLPARPSRAAEPGVVRTGADVADADGWKVFADRKIGIITNPTGVLTATLQSIVDEMHTTVEIGAVFGPEHGFRGAAQAGESEETYVDERTGVTVYDAYGADADKFAEFYEESDIDTVVFDIQDVGVRFYTYIWTMYEAMIAAVRTDKDFIVLDRPNPVGGKAHGTMMTDGFTSGVGKDKILQAHGMTVGEVARYFDGELLPDAADGRLQDLQVIEVEGWQTSQLFAETGLPWVMPSPNMPTADTALLYYGTGMFEAVNMSEGRGTTRPFEIMGAPYVDHRWAAELNDRELPGVQFREAYFTPTFSKWEGEVCCGVQVHITDPGAVRPIDVATHMMVAARDLYDDFGWRTLDGDTPGRWIGLLTGSKRFQERIEAGARAEAIITGWRRDEQLFERQRQPYLLYPRQG